MFVLSYVWCVFATAYRFQFERVQTSMDLSIAPLLAGDAGVLGLGVCGGTDLWL